MYKNHTHTYGDAFENSPNISISHTESYNAIFRVYSEIPLSSRRLPPRDNWGPNLLFICRVFTLPFSHPEGIQGSIVRAMLSFKVAGNTADHMSHEELVPSQFLSAHQEAQHAMD